MQAAAKPHALLPDMNVPAVHLNSCAIQEAGVLELTQLSLTSSVERSVALDAMARFRKEYAHAANPNTLLTVTTLEQSCKVHSILDAKSKPTDDQVMEVTGIYTSFDVLKIECRPSSLASLPWHYPPYWSLCPTSGRL